MIVAVKNSEGRGKEESNLYLFRGESSKDFFPPVLGY
jgi:hypothetical protein